MAFIYVYEQDVIPNGWPDDGGGGMTMPSWFDHDVADDHIIPLGILEPTFFAESDRFYVGTDPDHPMPPLTTEITAGFFVEQDVFFQPMSARALRLPAQMLRNEIRRVR